MLGRGKTSQQARSSSYSLKTNLTFENGLRDNLTRFFLFTFILFFPLLFSFSLCSFLFFIVQNVGFSSFGPYLALPGRNIPSEYTPPHPKWWKSILTRDQDLYDKQSLQLQAHQTHLNGRQKRKISAPCAFSWNPIENLLMPSQICAAVLLLMLSFREGIDKGMCSLGGVCGTGTVSVPWIKPLFFPPPSHFTSTSGITNKRNRSDDWLEATC